MLRGVRYLPPTGEGEISRREGAGGVFPGRAGAPVVPAQYSRGLRVGLTSPRRGARGRSPGLWVILDRRLPRRCAQWLVSISCPLTVAGAASALNRFPSSAIRRADHTARGSCRSFVNGSGDTCWAMSCSRWPHCTSRRGAKTPFMIGTKLTQDLTNAVETRAAGNHPPGIVVGTSVSSKSVPWGL